MKIGVISDTHIPLAAAELPPQIYEAFEGVDMILHAGDFVTLELAERLERIAPLKAVCGNMDSAGIRQRFPEKQVLELGGFTVGLCHGSGAAAAIMENVRAQFSGRPDAIVYGHSHTPQNLIKDKILYFNPGTPTDTVFAPYNSYGILYIDNGLHGEIIKL